MNTKDVVSQANRAKSKNGNDYQSSVFQIIEKLKLTKDSRKNVCYQTPIGRVIADVETKINNSNVLYIFETTTSIRDDRHKEKECQAMLLKSVLSKEKTPCVYVLVTQDDEKWDKPSEVKIKKKVFNLVNSGKFKEAGVDGIDVAIQTSQVKDLLTLAKTTQTDETAEIVRTIKEQLINKNEDKKS